MSEANFPLLFQSITGKDPFPWQSRLYEDFRQGVIPPSCDLPTGLGKTSVIPIWLFALAAKNEGAQIPRRLVYVVNRRTIVDQSSQVAYDLCEKLKEALKDQFSPLHETATALKGLGAISNGDGDLLAISTLRGELADNRQWSFDPMRPTLVIGTVDMIGSKLLFSGYGDSRRVRPLNAGFIGCDTLIVHDEAHLTPAFSLLLRKVEEVQNSGEPLPGFPPFRVLELSATSHKAEESFAPALSKEGRIGSPFTLESDDEENETVMERLLAVKKLRLHKTENQKDQLEKILELAWEHSLEKSRVVVFVQSPEDAVDVQKRLVEKLAIQAEESWRNQHAGESMEKAEKNALLRECQESVSILTGEIRGHERDLLMKKPGMAPFLEEIPLERTYYLVSTSAGEVGMDLHADHMVSDLTTLDSLVQRLGRVNRFGKRSDSRVDVVSDSSQMKEKKESLFKTLSLLEDHTRESTLDASPIALREILESPEAHEAFAPIPERVHTTDILLDLWSQTSLNDIPARPEVAPWLHGIQENLPETWMAWREEVSTLSEPELTEEELFLWFQRFPLSSKETLRRPTWRIKWTGAKEKKWVESHKDERVLLLSPNGQCRSLTIEELSQGESSLNFATIVFPTGLGGLNPDGFWDLSSTTPVEDVADPSVDRVVLEKRGDRYRFIEISPQLSKGSESKEEGEEVDSWSPWTTLKEAMREKESLLKKKCLLNLKVHRAQEWEDEPQERWLLLFKEPSSPSEQKGASKIDNHQEAVVRVLQRLTEKTSLPDSIKGALSLAAAYHDLGKYHERWQTAAGHEPQGGYAKPVSGGVDWRMLDGYRHELGSVVEAMDKPDVQSHPERELILHLIATHHGWARPHFEERAFPPGLSEETRNRTGLEVMKRFVRLQERFGYWRLAWLESLLRRADGIASKQEGEVEEMSDE